MFKEVFRSVQEILVKKILHSLISSQQWSLVRLVLQLSLCRAESAAGSLLSQSNKSVSVLYCVSQGVHRNQILFKDYSESTCNILQHKMCLDLFREIHWELKWTNRSIIIL